MAVIGICGELEPTPTCEALELVKDGVSPQRCVEHILQRTTGVHQQKGPPIHQLNQLANDVLILAEVADIEPP